MPDYTSWAGLLTPAPTQFGPDMKQIITLQNLAQQMQARQMVMQQEQQGQNALRQVFANKDNIDQSTGLPKPSSLGGVIQANPEMGGNLLKDISTVGHNKALAEAEQGKAYQGFQQAWVDKRKEAYAIYKKTLETSGPEAALKAYNDAWARGRDDLASGYGGSPEWINKIPQQAIPPEEALARNNTWDASHAKPMSAYESARLAIDENRERRETAAAGRGAVEATKNIKITKPDGSVETTTGYFDKDTKDWHRSGGAPITEGNVVEVPVGGGSGALHPGKEMAVIDKDGNVVWKGLAREGQNANELYESGTGKKIEIPDGGHPEAVTGGKLTVAGSRESVMQQRVLGSGLQAMTALKAITMMPSTVSSGPLGLGTERVGLLDAPRAMLAQALSSQDVQTYNAARAGLERQLSQIETQGLAPSGTFTAKFESLTLKPTDTLYTKMYKLADMRQIVENGMDTLLANDRLGKGQRDLANKIKDEIKASVPYTIYDMIGLQNSKNPKETLSSMGIKKFGGERIKVETDPDKANKQWTDAVHGTIFVDQHGNEYVKP